MLHIYVYLFSVLGVRNLAAISANLAALVANLLNPRTKFSSPGVYGGVNFGLDKFNLKTSVAATKGLQAGLAEPQPHSWHSV